MKGHVWERLDYFFLQGLFLGGVIGTAAFPIIGTIIGLFIGGGIGVVSGLINILIVARSRQAFFNEEFDADGYGRWLATRVGVCTTLVMAALYILFVHLISPRANILRDVVFLGSLTALGGGLISAYIAHGYPLWLLQHLSREGHFFDDQSLSSRPKARSAAWKLYRSAPRLRPFLIGALGAAFFMLSNIVRDVYPYLYEPGEFVRNILIGAAGAELLWMYIAMVNGLLLTALKRFNLNDYFPHLPETRSRRFFTRASFFVTLLTTWWTLFFAPLIAFYTAYTVSHVLALPDETPDKAKRKEKNALALEANIVEAGEDANELIAEERLTAERERR